MPIDSKSRSARLIGVFKAFDYESITVADSVKQLTTAILTDSASGKGASEVLITVETASLRYTLDGTDPVAGADGHLVANGGSVSITGPFNIKNLKMIRETGTSADIKVTYFG